jgi:diaminopimelate epimerase
MKVHFFKMHGAGNDFILVDDRAVTFPLRDAAWIRRLAARRTGVGCEGIILVQPSESAHFRMRFLNPDGNEVSMCGNGARCVARLAADLGIAPRQCSFETGAGVIEATVRDAGVTLRMTSPHSWRDDLRLTADGKEWVCGFVNTGVPHVVVEVDELAAAPVLAAGAALRYHPAFAPEGTNADFVEMGADGAVRVRTYERGVEGETLACGTGIVAAALTMAWRGRCAPPVTVHTAGGDVMRVDFRLTPDAAEGVLLTGPAEYVFEGDVTYEEGRA